MAAVGSGVNKKLLLQEAEPIKKMAAAWGGANHRLSGNKIICCCSSNSSTFQAEAQFNKMTFNLHPQSDALLSKHPPSASHFLKTFSKCQERGWWRHGSHGQHSGLGQRAPYPSQCTQQERPWPKPLGISIATLWQDRSLTSPALYCLLWLVEGAL